MSYPTLVNPVLDGTDIRELAEFYRQMFGWRYRKGDEPDAPGAEAEPGWVTLIGPDGERRLSFQKVERQTPTTWPSQDVPMQAHLDFSVVDPDDLVRQKQRAESLGATLLLDRSDDPDEPLFVFADPADHPFCLFTDTTWRD